MNWLFWLIVGLIAFTGAMLWYATLLLIYGGAFVAACLWAAFVGVLELLLTRPPRNPGRHRA